MRLSTFSLFNAPYYILRAIISYTRISVTGLLFLDLYFHVTSTLINRLLKSS
jgi:hypothetical protein